MAEYRKAQSSQLSRTIVNSQTASRQLKGFVDNRLKSNSLKWNGLTVRQRFEVHRFIPHSHSNSTDVWLKNNDKGKKTYGEAMNYKVGEADGMSTFHKSFAPTADFQKRTYVAPIQINDTSIEGSSFRGDRDDGPFKVNSISGYFAYRTPECANKSIYHFSINKKENWDGTSSAGLADVNDLSEAVKNDVKINPHAKETKNKNVPWTG